MIEIESERLRPDPPSSLLRMAACVRRTAVRLHRQLSGLRVLFHRLERQDTEGLPPALRIAAGRIAQRLDALDHEIVAMRERTRLLQEEITALTAEETNRHLYVLSILTTLVLPPTLVTGSPDFWARAIVFIGGLWLAYFGVTELLGLIRRVVPAS